MLVALRGVVKRTGGPRPKRRVDPLAGTEPAEAGPGRSATAVFAAAAFVLGVAARLAVTYPAHKTVNDADNVWNGLTALFILAGHAPVFYSGARLGALECYMTAAFFALFGASRAAMGLTPVLMGALALAAYYGLARELTNRVLAALALLFFALPSAGYMFWTYVPTTYPTTALLGILILLAAARIARRGPGSLRMLAFGLACGLGWWNSPQTLSCIVPAAAWVLWRRSEVLHSPRALALALAGLLVGASPWLGYNLVHPLATFRREAHLSPAVGRENVFENARDAMVRAVPNLFVRAVGDRSEGRGRVAGAVALGVIQSAALLLAVGAGYRWARGRRRIGTPPPPGLLFAAVAALAVLFYSVSGAGTFSVHGYGERYLLTAYFGIPLALACLVRGVFRASRPAAVVVTALVCGLNVWGYFLPGSPERRQWREGAGQDERAVAALERYGVGAVTGDFWLVNPLAFVSGERVRAVFDRQSDYASIRRIQPAAKWALVNPWTSQLRSWSRDVALRGPFPAAKGIEFWVADPSASAGNDRLDARLASEGTALCVPPDQDFFSTTGCRLLDTRSGSPGPTGLRAGIENLAIAGRCGIPREARFVSLNATVLEATAPGVLHFVPRGCGGGSIDFGPGNAIAHALVSPAQAGAIRIETTYPEGAGFAHLIVDVNGYFVDRGPGARSPQPAARAGAVDR